MNVRYILILTLWVKIEDVIEVSHSKMESGWHGKFGHVEEQGYIIIHAWYICDV